MSDLIRLAPGLTLDADYVAGGTFALLGKKGSGKSFTTRVLAEEFWRAGVQFVLIDPMGANWGLRSSADGQGEGLPIPIFGGKHADAPLERTAGALMADLVVRDRLSMIVDLSEFGSHAAERQFVHDFLDRLYRTNDEDLVHVLLDEADLYAPQKPAPGDQAVKGVVDNTVRRGRNKAIAITLITQRSAVLDKDVLTQCDGVVLLRLTGPQDRDAAMRWVETHGEPEENAAVRASLPELANGEAWIWIPELKVFERVQIRMSRTFDSSPTRTRKGRGPAPKGYADVDLAAIAEKIAATIDRAKAEDPKELRKRIRELEAQLAKQRTETKIETITETVEVEVVPEAVTVAVASMRDALTAIEENAQRGRELALGLLGDVLAKGRRRETPAQSARPAPPTRAAAAPSRRPAPAREPVDVGDLRLGKAHRSILAVLDQRRGLITSKRQVAVATGYAINGGGFNKPLGALRSAGLIEGSDPITITDAGAESIAGQYEPLPTGAALLEHWCRLGKAHGLILRELARHYPDSLSKQDLADATGYEATGGGFNSPLGKLRTLELIEGSGELRLTEAFGQEVGGVMA